jgi:hypothetical protein
MMLPFRIHKTAVNAAPETVHLNPAAIASITEQEHRHGNGELHKVAVITLTHGGRFIVEDDDRTAAQSIAEAQAELREEPNS